jgi:hypothetical protein
MKKKENPILRLVPQKLGQTVKIEQTHSSSEKDQGAKSLLTIPGT